MKQPTALRVNAINVVRNLPPINQPAVDNELKSPLQIDQLNNSMEEDQQENPDQQKIDYERRNLDKLKALQEARQRELKMIEDERQKMLRKQEKLKNMILQQAAEYKEKKKQRELERAAATEQEQQQQKAKGKGSPKKSKKYAKSLEQKEQ